MVYIDLSVKYLRHVIYPKYIYLARHCYYKKKNSR